MKSRAVFSIVVLHLLLLLLILSPTKTNAVGDLVGYKICLDPGHGGTDLGAVNNDYNLRESDISLEVSYGLRHLLEDAGAVTIYDSKGQPVPSAEVTLQVVQLPDGAAVVETVLTDAGGVATFRTKTSFEGQYQATVLDVTKAEWSYDAAANIKSSALLAIP